MSDDALQRYSADDLVFVQTLNIAEALGNLNYLIRLDAENPEAVRSHLLEIEDLLRRLVALVRCHHTECR